MFKDLKNGLKVFINKKTIFVLALLTFSFFGLNFLFNTLFEELVFGISLKEYPSFLINYYGIDMLWFILALFLFYFLMNYASYLISHIINKSNKNILKDIPNCIIFTFFTFLIFFTFGVIGYLSFLYLSIFSIFIVIILSIFSIPITLLLTFGILFLAVSKDIKESLQRSWGFLKQKFWILILLIIILGIISFAISYAFEWILLKLQENDTIAIIVYVLFNIMIYSYTTAVFSSFIKKKKYTKRK